MNPQDNNPSGRPPSLYQMSTQRERKGGGGMLVLGLVLVLLAAGAAYYFLKMRKPATVASALPAAATPRPARPAPTPMGYNSVTEQSYIDQADKAFLAVQQPKIKAFNEAFAAFKAAGYVNVKGLTSKEAVAARRELIAKCLATNDDYAAFVATQNDTYKDDLAKTPLTPADVTTTLNDYAVRAKTPEVVKMRQAEHDYLKSADDMMAALEKWSGGWSVSPEGKLALKRKEYIGEYNELAQKCTAQANLVAKLQSEYTGAVVPAGAAATGADGSAPSPAPGATSPAPAQP